MTQEAASFVIWKPEHDGHAPPNWREGMKWGVDNLPPKDCHSDPSWGVDYVYIVPAEALNSPNDDAAAEQKIGRVEIVVGSKRQRKVVSLNELARLIKGGAAIYGITLAPEKDWATELSEQLRELYLYDQRNEAIALIRERVVLKGEG